MYLQVPDTTPGSWRWSIHCTGQQHATWDPFSALQAKLGHNSRFCRLVGTEYQCCVCTRSLYLPSATNTPCAFMGHPGGCISPPISRLMHQVGAAQTSQTWEAGPDGSERRRRGDPGATPPCPSSSRRSFTWPSWRFLAVSPVRPWMCAQRQSNVPSSPPSTLPPGQRQTNASSFACTDPCGRIGLGSIPHDRCACSPGHKTSDYPQQDRPYLISSVTSPPPPSQDQPRLSPAPPTQTSAKPTPICWSPEQAYCSATVELKPRSPNRNLGRGLPH